jgi:hypothetical protein
VPFFLQRLGKRFVTAARTLRCSAGFALGYPRRGWAIRAEALRAGALSRRCPVWVAVQAVGAGSQITTGISRSVHAW